MPVAKNTDNSGCVTSFTKCIQYNGPDIPCLGIVSGDYINEVIAILVDKICEISQPQDLSTLTIQCLIDKFTGISEPLSKNVLSYLQLLINNQCSLKDLIDAINLRIDGIKNTNLILDLKCLSSTDSFGNPLPFTQQSVLQQLINETCSFKGSINTINITLINLQSQIDDLKNNPPDNEKIVSSCLYSGKTTSNALNITASKVCSLETLYGNSSQVNTALSQQCEGLGQQFSTNSNFIQNVKSLAESENNQWVVICNMLNDLKVLKDCACKIKCSDIKLGWQVNDNEVGDGATLDFSGAFGNVVNALYTDCGSTVTFIDHTGKKKSYILNIRQEYTSPEFDLSMLDLSKLITIKVCAKLCYDGETCCICEESQHLVESGTCNVCDITISGTTGTTVITYNHNGRITSITATVGEIVYIPKDAINVTYVTLSGDAAPNLGTTCLTITQSVKKCWLFKWEKDTGSAPLNDCVFVELLYNGTVLNLGNTDYMSSYNQLAHEINDANNVNVKATCGLSQGLQESLVVEILDNGSNIIPELKVGNPTGVPDTLFMYIKGVEKVDCCTGLTTATPIV